jgi:hypothetical protein
MLLREQWALVFRGGFGGSSIVAINISTNKQFNISTIPYLCSQNIA